jgi:hypothetical protein
MDSFVAAGYKAIELLRLNLCRKWSQAISLADLVSGDGYHLLTGVLTGIQQRETGRPGIAWPAQGPLPTSYWNLWARALRHTFQIGTNGTLSKPLGPWTDPTGRIRLDPNCNKVYVPQGSIWQVYSVSGWTILHSHATSLEAIVSVLPTDCWVGNGRVSNSRILTTGWSPLWQETPSVPPPLTVPEAALQLPAHLQWTSSIAIASSQLPMAPSRTVWEPRHLS